MVLNKAKILLNLSDEDKIKQLESIISIQEDALRSKLDFTEANWEESPRIPFQLQYIVLETSIARYNRLGSEGLKTEGIDVISQSFTDDLFDPYLKDIESYNKKYLDSLPKSSKRLKLL